MLTLFGTLVQIGSLRSMVESVDGLGLAAPDRAKVLGGNAARLLGVSV